jgi:hypothetical protein
MIAHWQKKRKHDAGRETPLPSVSARDSVVPRVMGRGPRDIPNFAQRAASLLRFRSRGIKRDDKEGGQTPGTQVATAAAAAGVPHSGQRSGEARRS